MTMNKLNYFFYLIQSKSNIYFNLYNLVRHHYKNGVSGKLHHSRKKDILILLFAEVYLLNHLYRRVSMWWDPTKWENHSLQKKIHTQISHILTDKNYNKCLSRLISLRSKTKIERNGQLFKSTCLPTMLYNITQFYYIFGVQKLELWLKIYKFIFSF